MLSRTPKVIRYMCCYALTRVCHACCLDMEPHLELLTFALWWLGEIALCTMDLICHSVKQFSRLWDSMLRVKGVGAPLLSELLEMYSARVRGDGCSLSLSLAHIISISCSFEFCGRLFCLQVWMMPSVTVNGMKCICYYALSRVWHACCKFLCSIDFGSCVWGLDFGIPSGVVDLVIVRKCTL